MSSSFVRELPLDALLPQTIQHETATIVNNPIEVPKQATPPLIYPRLEPAKPLPQIVLNGDAVEATRVLSDNVEHKNIYPNIEEIAARTLHGECELLNEAQLLTYYQNETLEFVEDFVDEFVSVCSFLIKIKEYFKRELSPRNTLHNLLEKFREVCEQIHRNEDAKKTLVVNLEHTNNEVWVIEDRKVSKSGRCGDDRRELFEIK